MTRPRRINLLVSEEEKAAIEAKASAAGLSSSELIRRAVELYDAEIEPEELKVIVREMNEAVTAIKKDLNEARETLRDYNQKLASMGSYEPKLGEEWPFEVAE